MKNKMRPAVIAFSLSLLLLAGCEQADETGQDMEKITSGVADDFKNDAIEIKEETSSMIENKTDASQEAATELLDTSKEAVDKAMN
ncbi:MAG: hypothetical protein GXP14_04340 [Gammaproteobacteria bacterium]|nr:hypothetical protein [Gammaproteobacteria bacterium]